MKVTLLHATPAWIAIAAIRQCYDSTDKSDSTICVETNGVGEGCSIGQAHMANYGVQILDIGEKDASLIKKVIKSGHTSTLEHVSVTLKIEGISRAVLQEIQRHRMSVQSTRYTLKKFLSGDVDLEDMLVETGNESIDAINQMQLNAVKNLAKTDNIPNDILKYGIPEAFKTSLILTINMRSLRNMLELRLAKTALWEFRQLAQAIYDALPKEHRIFVDDIVDDSDA